MVINFINSLSDFTVIVYIYIYACRSLYFADDKPLGSFIMLGNTSLWVSRLLTVRIYRAKNNLKFAVVEGKPLWLRDSLNAVKVL